MSASQKMPHRRATRGAKMKEKLMSVQVLMKKEGAYTRLEDEYYLIS